jgi:hypothetical protein
MILFGLGGAFTWKYRDLSFTLFSALLALYGVILAILTFTYGSRFRKVLKEICNGGKKEDRYKAFLDKVIIGLIIPINFLQPMF